MRRSVGGWLAVVGAAVAVAAFCSPARASYTVYGCALPDGAPAPLDGWTLSATGGGMAVDLCGRPPNPATALYLGLDSGPIAVGSSARAVFRAPLSTVIAGGVLFRYFGASGGSADRNVAVWGDDNSMVNGCTPVDYCQALGDSNVPFSPANRLDLPATLKHQLTLQVQCEASPAVPYANLCSDASFETAGTALVYAMRIALEDLSAPRFVAVPRGSLLQPQIGGVRSATVDVADAGGGVARVLLLADGRVVGQQAVDPVGGCRVPYVRVVPCPLSAHVTLSYDTRALPDGPHRLSVAVEDAGGNRTVSGSFAVTVANGGGPNGVHASRAARLSGRFVGGGRVSYGRRARLAGKLVDSAGRAIGSAQLQVVQRTRLQGAPWRPVGTAVTNAAGRFAVRLNEGPSRDVRVVYRAFATDPAPAAQLQGRLLVRAGVRLRVSPRRVEPNGRIRFTGSLLGGPGRGGAIVTLYVFAGRRIPVAVLHTDRHGRFSFAYRFSRTFQPTTFAFWVQVDRQRGYPYARGSSRRVLVRVL